MNISKKTNTCSKLAKETPEEDEKIVNKLTIRLQGIIQRKSASGSRTLPLVIFDKKVPFFIKIVVLRYFCGKLCQNCSFLKNPDAGQKF